MTARKPVATIVLLILAFILASCGGGATATPTNVPPTEQPATQAATEEVAATPAPTEESVVTEEAAADATEQATEATAESAASAGDVMLTVTQENTALRGGPGTNYEVVVRVTVNASYPVVATYGEGRNQWYQITLEDGTTAWAWSRVVTLNPADAVVPVAAEVPPPPAS